MECHTCAARAALRMSYQSCDGAQPRVEDLCMRCCAVVIAQMPDKFQITAGVPIENLHVARVSPEPEREQKRLRIMEHPCNNCHRDQQAFSVTSVQHALNDAAFCLLMKKDLCYCCTAAALLDMHAQPGMHLAALRHGALSSLQ